MADEEKAPAKFSFGTVDEFTGKVQYRSDDMASVEAPPFGTWKRGEVKHVKNQKAAESLVRSGHFSHVAAETSVGQPEEFAAMDKKTKKPGEPLPVAPAESDPDANAPLPTPPPADDEGV